MIRGLEKIIMKCPGCGGFRMAQGKRKNQNDLRMWKCLNDKCNICLYLNGSAEYELYEKRD